MWREARFGYIVLFLSASAGAQDHPCEVDIPVNVVTSEVGLVRHLRQEEFIARRGDATLAIRSVDADTAPRRIVLVVENGKNVNPAARKVE